MVGGRRSVDVFAASNEFMIGHEALRGLGMTFMASGMIDGVLDDKAFNS